MNCDAVYKERNQLVALLSTLFPSGKAKTAIDGWDEAWHGCVYIDFPWGQASWHYHSDDEHMFAHLPPYTKPWDGHTTEEKYAAIAALRTAIEQAEKQEPVAFVTGYYDGHCVIKPLNRSMVFPTGMGLYVAPVQGGLTDSKAWLETRRLARLWGELDQIDWVRDDGGWNKAIKAVRDRLDRECKDVLGWKEYGEIRTETVSVKEKNT